MWAYDTVAVVKFNKLNEMERGQGEGETKWNGWAWKALLFIFNIVIY